MPPAPSMRARIHHHEHVADARAEFNRQAPRQMQSQNESIE
jgi:hypothetical protein